MISVGIGKKIRYHRLKLEMTQLELAKGIISVSYLSKIENGVSEPPLDIAQLLFEKLNTTPHTKETKKTYNLCQKWFYILLQGETGEASDLYKEIIKNSNNISNTSLVNLVEIHKLHYHVLTRQKEEAEKQLHFLKKLSKRFKEEEKYYWLKILGNYYFSCLLYNKSLSLYLKAKEHLNSQVFYLEEEKADLYYMIAVSSSKLRKNHIVDIYANKSLNYYQKTYQMKRCAECHILLGILYHRINDLDKSMESYQISSSIAKDINNSIILSICYQNIGKLHSVMNHPEKAIKYYFKSYNSRLNSSPTKKIIPISSLMKEYYKENNLFNAEKWLYKGLELLNELPPSDSIYVYEFKVYKHLIKDKGVNKSFEKLVLKRIIPFFKKRKLFYEQHIYLNLLANYYFTNRKYKLAAIYYKSSGSMLANLYKE